MANTISTSLLSYLGMVGNTASSRTGSLVPRSSTPDSYGQQFNDFFESGRVADPDIWSKFNSAMKRPVTFDSMLQLWDEMASWDLLAAAMVEIVDEATNADQHSPGTIWYECNDKEVEDDLNQMLANMDVESIIQSQIYYVATMGNHFEKIEYAPSEGVLGLSFIHPMDVRRYWLEKNRRCIGFRWAGHKPDKNDVFVSPDNKTPIPRVSLSDGRDVEDLWYPWDILHMRRMFRLRMSEHGEPVFDEAQGIYKRLRMAVDQMTVHRAQVQPDRYAINIDTKDQGPMEQMKTVQRWKQMLRSKISFGTNAATGGGLGGPTDFQSFHNAWALDTVLWVAKPNGFNHAIEKIGGTANVPDIYDIELLLDMFYAVIGMPRSWFGAKGGEGQEGQSPSGKSLLAQDMRFLRKVKSIRKPVLRSYTWLGYFHSVLRGKNISQLEIKAMMPPIGGLEEQMKLEMLKMQAEVLDVLADIMDKYNLPKEAWIEIVFKKYMHLPDEVVNVFMTALPAEAEPAQQESLRAPAPASYRLIREVEDTLARRGAGKLVQRLQEGAHKQTAKALLEKDPTKYRKPTDVLSIPELRDRDLIVSSFGKHPFTYMGSGVSGQAKSSKPLMETWWETDTEPQATTTQVLSTGGTPEPAYRRWVRPR